MLIQEKNSLAPLHQSHRCATYFRLVVFFRIPTTTCQACPVPLKGSRGREWPNRDVVDGERLRQRESSLDRDAVDP